jgi:hypothetical protein
MNPSPPNGVQLFNLNRSGLVVSNASGSATSSNAVLTVTTNGPVTNVLLLVDNSFVSPYRTALINLGRAHQLFTVSSSFNTAVSNANPANTLVVVDAHVTNRVLNVVGRSANAGGRAILQYWGMDVGSALAAAFNANVASVLVTPLPSTPIPVYNWGGSGFFAGLSSPVSFVGSLVYDGQKLQPAAGGQAVAGWTSAVTSNQAAIVVGHSGRTILNGCLLEEANVVSNAVRLAQNELEYFFLPAEITLLAPMVVGGQFQFTLSGPAFVDCSLQVSSNFMDWITVTNITLATNPIPLTIPVTAGQSFFRAVSPPVP